VLSCIAECAFVISRNPAFINTAKAPVRVTRATRRRSAQAYAGGSSSSSQLRFHRLSKCEITPMRRRPRYGEIPAAAAKNREGGTCAERSAHWRSTSRQKSRPLLN